MKVKLEDGPAVVLLDEVGEVNRGETVDVSAETGKQLLEQGWAQVGGSTKKATTKKKATTTDASGGEKSDAAAAGDTTQKEDD